MKKLSLTLFSILVLISYSISNSSEKNLAKGKARIIDGDTIEIDKEKIRKFLKATELATQFIINNPEESWKIFASTSKELNDQLNKMAWADTIPRFALRPPALDAGRYLEFQDFLLQNKLINKAFPISKIAIDVTRN